MGRGSWDDWERERNGKRDDDTESRTGHLKLATMDDWMWAEGDRKQATSKNRANNPALRSRTSL
jgi:hypothetical protein